ncbi:putative lysine N-acyltransferase [Neolecta irregularis DAH-3]|uniref:Putative lysine N-acyltransferase n=1 Tax=Neolecta irregularis (strain DAH-3) TaxID=1198029 RepID=A0A1U7LT96_NEOID|nr:putative lysine N-acyltransferase [Neolecta irregularis DAH-3]|eukprot:OLL25838.1 putative lysine N-acyltransferase [Neolecta irregularis DAH-3]
MSFSLKSIGNTRFAFLGRGSQLAEFSTVDEGTFTISNLVISSDQNQTQSLWLLLNHLFLYKIDCKVSTDGKPSKPREIIIAVGDRDKTTNPVLSLLGNLDIAESRGQSPLLFAIGFAEFWQWDIGGKEGWRKSSALPNPLRNIFTGPFRHPRRPTAPMGLLYQRFIPSLNETFSLQVANPAADIENFHEWMNNPRVVEFWGEKGSKERHLEYLTKVTADRHCIPTFGYFNGTPFAYFEIYWAKEDHVSPYANANDWDRGWHILVGNEKFRGSHRVGMTLERNE